MLGNCILRQAHVVTTQGEIQMPRGPTKATRLKFQTGTVVYAISIRLLGPLSPGQDPADLLNHRGNGASFMIRPSESSRNLL